MIENSIGINALDEILQEPHVDFVSLGQTDLSSDMGYHGDIRHPEVVKLVGKLGDKIKAAGKAAGSLILTQDDYIYWRDQEFQVMCCVAASMFLDGATALKGDISRYEHSHQSRAAHITAEKRKELLLRRRS
jgi:2-keto-3-deoxy-L-rhamnonate aldolase RhmA